MLELGQAAALLLAAGLFTLAPGPDNLIVLRLGLSRGRKQGMAFGFGCALGYLSHTLLAALGLSAVLSAKHSGTNPTLGAVVMPLDQREFRGPKVFVYTEFPLI